MATVHHNSMLLVSSSPYSRRGVLWNMHKQYHGKDDPRVLSWQSATDQMNNTISPDVIAQAYEQDAASAAAEWGGQFRIDIEGYITREAVDAVTSDNERERPYVADTKYQCFVDPSGGAADSFTLAIGHMAQDGTAVLDVLRETKAPFSPKAVVEEYCTLLKSYSISKCTGDRYAAEWPREVFRDNGITYEPSLKPKSQLYLELLPAINSKKCDLLDNDRLMNQLVGLERRTARGGKDSVDHSPNAGAKDDVANCCAGLIVGLISRGKSRYVADLSWVGDWTSDDVRRTQSVGAERLATLMNSKGF